jgi:hypothetical protein
MNDDKNGVASCDAIFVTLTPLPTSFALSDIIADIISKAGYPA